jgi:membrane-bound ClpP family serine protease
MDDIASLSPQKWVVAGLLLALILLAAVKLLWGMALWAMKSPHRVGARFGAEPVEVVEWAGGTGLVRAGGELWKATSSDSFAPGERVKVAGAKGLVLEIRRQRAAADAAADQT